MIKNVICSEFPCSKFKDTKEYQALETSSYPLFRKIIPNLNFIKENGIGIEKFIKQQEKPVRLLETMIENFITDTYLHRLTPSPKFVSHPFGKLQICVGR
jgi:hypothetical protein